MRKTKANKKTVAAKRPQEEKRVLALTFLFTVLCIVFAGVAYMQRVVVG